MRILTYYKNKKYSITWSNEVTINKLTSNSHRPQNRFPDQYQYLYVPYKHFQEWDRWMKPFINTSELHDIIFVINVKLKKC